MTEKNAMQASNNCTPDDPNFPNKKLYKKFPSSIEELDERINDFQARLECMEEVGENVSKHLLAIL